MRLVETLGEAAVQIFESPFARVTASRFRDAAYGLWKREQEDEARSCLAAAAGFEAIADGAAAAENPVASAFVEVMLAPLLTRLEQEQEQEGGEEESLLVKP